MALPSVPTSQFALLILIPALPNKVPTLSAILEQVREQTIALMQGQTVEAPLFPFDQLKQIHYARFVLIDGDKGLGTGPQLAFALDYDGPFGVVSAEPEARKLLIAALIRVARVGLDR